MGETIEYQTTRIQDFQDHGHRLDSGRILKLFLVIGDIDDQNWFVLLQHDICKVNLTMSKSQILNQSNNQMDLSGHLVCLREEVNLQSFTVQMAMRIYRMLMCKRLIGSGTLTFDKVTGELVDETRWCANKTEYYDIILDCFDNAGW